MKMKFFAVFFFLLIVARVVCAQDFSALDRIPVLDGGRVKPFQTYSREVLLFIYGKPSFQNRSASAVLLTWMAQPQIWNDIQFVRVVRQDLKKVIGLSLKTQYFSPKELFDNKVLQNFFDELDSKKSADLELDPLMKSLDDLRSQLALFQFIAYHQGVLLFRSNGDWVSLRQASQKSQNAFSQVIKAFLSELSDPSIKQNLDQAVDKFISETHSGQRDLDSLRIRAEIHYNQWQPFRIAWILYLISVICFFIFFIFNRLLFFQLSFGVLLIGWFFHTYGFILRVYLTQRAPVTNMYESVLWVSWGVILFSLWLKYSTKQRYFLSVGAVTGLISLIVADHMSKIFDPSLQPLEAVLRNNFWLTLHVLTITFSYSTFLLAAVIGNYSLYLSMRDERLHENKIKQLTSGIYRCLQVGVFLLSFGILTGGIWADYSWGRFWGWDPKETWSLIALLGYIALLHARLIGWVHSFGMAVGSILSFVLVLIAWIGVNILVPSSLHSYGFSSGEVGGIIFVVVLNLTFVVFVCFSRKKRI